MPIILPGNGKQAGIGVCLQRLISDRDRQINCQNPKASPLGYYRETFNFLRERIRRAEFPGHPEAVQIVLRGAINTIPRTRSQLVTHLLLDHPF